MESYGLEMDDLFDDRDIAQELNESATMAEPNDGEQDNEETNMTHNEDGNISQQVAEKLRQLGTGAAKKRVLRPQPKLDPTRLTGERGIPILPDVFQNVKYKGKGHEISDLNKMMSVTEHWAHRLFPKIPFDEFIERVERLGQKKPVQTCVSKIRLDMPLLDSDFVRQVSDEEGVEENMEQQLFGQTDDVPDEDEEVLNEMLQESTNTLNTILTASTPHTKSNSTQQPAGLTEEQLERIQENQRKARERLLNKSALNSTQDSEQMDISHHDQSDVSPPAAEESSRECVDNSSNCPSDTHTSNNVMDNDNNPTVAESSTSLTEDNVSAVTFPLPSPVAKTTQVSDDTDHI